MKIRAAILCVVALLLVGSVALRQVRSVALAQSGGPLPLVGYAAEKGVASGGGYRLMSLVHIWQVGEVASGGGYRLLSPASPGGGNQCCCTYVPCVVRSFH
jgi:hypothetical protein